VGFIDALGKTYHCSPTQYQKQKRVDMLLFC
jgi:hypothetical protein